MIDSKPLVSVIMPMFNSERFIDQSIQSILTQSYENLECIIVDDGSSDRSRKIVEELQKTDSRIRLICLAKNQGVSVASNIAIQSANGKYIARMDADDISLKHRFLLQVSFMEAHPDVGILGGKMQYMDETGELSGIPPMFQGELSIRWHILFESPFFNPTVMLRKSIIDHFDLKYDTSAIYGEEDYDFLSRLISLTKGENLSEILLHYRLNPNSLSFRYVNERNKSVVNISTRAVKMLLPNVDITQENILDLQRAVRGTSSLSKSQRSLYLPVYLKLWEEFCRNHKGEPDLLKLKQEVVAWAASLILYPPFQASFLKATWLLTKAEWRWPFFLLWKLPFIFGKKLSVLSFR